MQILNGKRMPARLCGKLAGLLLGAMVMAMSLQSAGAQNTGADNEGDNKMTLVLSAPRSDDSYYWRVYDQVLRYQRDYALKIMKYDDVVIFTDRNGYEYFSEHLPQDILIERPLRDIWVRDFSTVLPRTPLRFRYAAAAQGGDRREADKVQKQFARQIKAMRLTARSSRYILDGGNFVGDDAGKVIVTDRFLKDNGFSKERGIAVLKRTTKATQVAIIPTDDPDGLAHADGMVMFTDPNTLFVNAYREPLRSDILRELRRAFPAVKIIELPFRPDNTVWDPDFPSACGIYVNATVTDNAVYLPQFGTNLDARVLRLVRANTAKKVVPVDSASVCFMGGSARCLVWQQVGRNAAYLQRAARRQ